MHEATTRRPVVRLRKTEWDQLMDDMGLTTPDARAGHIGLSRTTVWRVEDERIKPGEEFVAAVLDSFPDLKFEDVFEITPADAERDEQGSA